MKMKIHLKYFLDVKIRKIFNMRLYSVWKTSNNNVLIIIIIIIFISIIGNKINLLRWNHDQSFWLTKTEICKNVTWFWLNPIVLQLDHDLTDDWLGLYTEVKLWLVWDL